MPRLDPSQVKAFQRRLLRWYARHARNLPWRRTRDPYRILVSEIMLQQTQVERVLGYYDQFLRRFPSIAALAAASEPAVRETWDGLGYYARARNLHRTARTVVADHGGRIPNDPAVLRRLPGIGRYTTGAVLSIAYGQDTAILDTNAARVLQRVFGVRRVRSKAALQRRLWDVAEAVTPTGKADRFNQAIMDLGATICQGRTPRCAACPVRRCCRSVESPALVGTGSGRVRRGPRRAAPRR